MLFFHLEDIIFSAEMGLCDRVVYQGEDEDRLREFRCGCRCCCEVKSLGTQETAYVSHVLKEMRYTLKADKILPNVSTPIPRVLKVL